MKTMKCEGVSRVARGLPSRTAFEAFRREMKMTQEALGQKLGLSKSLIERYEAGRGIPSPHTWSFMVKNAKANGLILPPSILDGFMEKMVEDARIKMEQYIKD